ncbi:HAMP domain-containing sensor histidine kinase [Halopseudomonas pachastrellae]|nr:HAMP domain-containing sensor histidine kinase [Halopseudomonas pachastrellae]
MRASHELRTPVTGMHMAFALLQERLEFTPGSREQDLFDTVDEEMRRLVDLINDTAQLLAHQNGLQKLELEPCDPRELVRAVVSRFEAQAQQQGISMHEEIDEEVAVARLDRLQLERVLDNLVGNALRHSDVGGSITVSVQRNGKRIVFAVTDTGEGIPYSQQIRVFEPFVQGGARRAGPALAWRCARRSCSCTVATLV